MPNILVVTGSVRPNSVNQKVVPIVMSEIEAQGATAVLGDLKAINLPFFDAPLPPSHPDFTATNESVIEWTKLVAEADGVVLVTPEYNHTMSPVQLNAVDWIYKEWNGKPVALVGYGWRGAVQAQATAREVLAVNLKAKVGDEQASLFLTKDLDTDGSLIDEANVMSKISASVKELLANI